jgi:dTDP-4-dehydrorhamnose 3,5-epimerase
MMIVDTNLPGVRVIRPQRLGDERGYFCETYSKPRYATVGIVDEFVQDNHSYSRDRGVVRGLHFQTPPFAQAKLVWAVRGRFLDVVVDLRIGAPTFGAHIMAEISAEAGNQIYIPAGFAHGLCTLEPETEVFYKVSAAYAPEHDAGVAWDDPDLGIAWPIAPAAAILSPKDRRHPRLKDLPQYFFYSGETF